MRPAVAAAVRLRSRWPSPAGPAATVLGWHRVDTEGGRLAIPPALFARQMALLAQRRHDVPVVSVDAAQASLSSPGVRSVSVVLTFDDAWADNHTNALGPLTEHRLPATLYTPSRLLGQPKYMTRSQLLEMAAAGITIGAHSQTHAFLPSCTPADLEREVRGSKEDLEDLIGAPVTSFAYPAGLHNDAVVAAVAKAGFTSAVTSRPGWWRPASHPLRIPRGIVEDFTDATFGAAVHGGLGALNPLDALKRLAQRWSGRA